jgi:uncharacterized membrane protein
MHTIAASIVIEAPVSECYKRWAEFEQFPIYMRRIQSVRALALPATSHLKHQSRHTPEAIHVLAPGEIAHEIEAHGHRVWEWKVKGPLGQAFTWIAGVVLDEPNKAITWVTPPDQEIASSGTVNFLPQKAASKLATEDTLIELRATFASGGGPLGELVSDFFRYGDNVAADCLEDFKHYVETDYVTEQRRPRYRTLS